MSTKGFEFERSNPADSLIIELQQMEEPPPPPPKPEPPPPKPQPLKPPKVQPQPRPAPATELPAPAQPAQVQPQPALEPAPPPPEIVAITPREETPPTFTAPPPPPPEPPRIVGPSQQEIDAARSGYSLLLAREFSKHRQYPRIAQLRGWQGTVRVQLELDSNGNITQSSIKESSGFDVLDRQAMEMVKKATPLPLPPEVLRNRAFSILVPVVFKLN